MDFNQIFEAITYNLNTAMQSDDISIREKHTNNAEHFFHMLVEDILDGKMSGHTLGGKIQQKPQPVTTSGSSGSSNIEPYDHYAHYKPGDIPGLAESWMSTRAGAMGQTFGEAPKLSQCCKQGIVDGVCSHCNKKCKELPNETQVNEALDKIKNLF